MRYRMVMTTIRTPRESGDANDVSRARGRSRRTGGSPRRGGAAYAARLSSGSTGRGAAWAALVVGLLYAAISVYWGLGGTWLLDTVSGLLQQGLAGKASVILAVWAAVALKLIAAVLPLLALHELANRAWNRTLWVAAWAEAAILTVYGLVLTATGLLVQAGLIHVSPTADHRALAWHAYLWDPWFLIWGLLVAAALLRSRPRRVRGLSAR